jgi:hypothetical protein
MIVRSPCSVSKKKWKDASKRARRHQKRPEKGKKSQGRHGWTALPQLQ